MMQCDIRAFIIQRSSYMSTHESNLTKISELINKLKACHFMHPSTNHQPLSKSDITPKRIMQAKKVQINVLQQSSR